MATIQLRTDDLNGESLPDTTPTTRLYVEDPRGDLSIEIDLSDTSFKGLQKALDKFIAKSRPVTAPTKGKGKKLGEAGASESEKARHWAIAHGMDVKDKGRVPVAAIVAYRAYLDNTSDEDRMRDQAGDIDHPDNNTE